MPPTPPPDIDLEAWEKSLDLVASWSPQRLALTHFGAVDDDIPAYLQTARARLREEASLAKDLPENVYEQDLQHRIREQMTAEGLGQDTVEELLQAVPTAYQWRGLDRYWKKHDEPEKASG
jgi:hypothetical protein